MRALLPVLLLLAPCRSQLSHELTKLQRQGVQTPHILFMVPEAPHPAEGGPEGSEEVASSEERRPDQDAVFVPFAEGNPGLVRFHEARPTHEEAHPLPEHGPPFVQEAPDVHGPLIHQGQYIRPPHRAIVPHPGGPPDPNASPPREDPNEAHQPRIVPRLNVPLYPNPTSGPHHPNVYQVPPQHPVGPHIIFQGPVAGGRPGLLPPHVIHQGSQPVFVPGAPQQHDPRAQPAPGQDFVILRIFNDSSQPELISENPEGAPKLLTPGMKQNASVQQPSAEESVESKEPRLVLPVAEIAESADIVGGLSEDVEKGQTSGGEGQPSAASSSSSSESVEESGSGSAADTKQLSSSTGKPVVETAAKNSTLTTELPPVTSTSTSAPTTAADEKKEPVIVFMSNGPLVPPMISPPEAKQPETTMVPTEKVTPTNETSVPPALQPESGSPSELEPVVIVWSEPPAAISTTSTTTPASLAAENVETSSNPSTSGHSTTSGPVSETVSTTEARPITPASSTTSTTTEATPSTKSIPVTESSMPGSQVSEKTDEQLKTVDFVTLSTTSTTTTTTTSPTTQTAASATAEHGPSTSAVPTIETSSSTTATVISSTEASTATSATTSASSTASSTTASASSTSTTSSSSTTDIPSTVSTRSTTTAPTTTTSTTTSSTTELPITSAEPSTSIAPSSSTTTTSTAAPTTTTEATQTTSEAPEFVVEPDVQTEPSSSVSPSPAYIPTEAGAVELNSPEVTANEISNETANLPETTIVFTKEDSARTEAPAPIEVSYRPPPPPPSPSPPPPAPTTPHVVTVGPPKYYELPSEKDKPSVFPTQTVRTRNGQMKGNVIKTSSGVRVNSFLGIPYAQPPLGAMRFERPMEFPPWTGVFEAKRLPKSCPQPSMQLNGFVGVNISDTSEDCLYLNIWSPFCDGSKKCRSRPVIVYIHGGGFIHGGVNWPIFDGAELAAKAEVLVVSLNYRLGALGFLYVPSNGGRPERANMGLYDQHLALRWVKSNIKAFGGDHNKITIMGQDAGAASVGYHILTPRSTGLFKRAVMQSGSPFTFVLRNTKDQGETLFRSLASYTDCTSVHFNSTLRYDDVLQCMKKLPFENIIAASEKFNGKGANSFFPVLGDEFIPMSPKDSLLLKRFSNVDLLVTTTKSEGAFFLQHFLSPFTNVADPDKINPGEIVFYLRVFLSALLGGKPTASLNELTQNTEPDTREERVQFLKNISAVIGDYPFLCATTEFGSEYANLRHNVYHMQFDHRPWFLLHPTWFPSTHGDDIMFWLGSVYKLKERTRADERVADELMAILTAFAGKGTPQTRGKLTWPRINQGGYYMSVGSEVTELLRTPPSNCRHWSRHYPHF